MSNIAHSLLAAQRLLLITHVIPDGDALGSTLGLAWGLRQLDKTVTLVCAGPINSGLQFLPGVEAFLPQAPAAHFDRIVVLDSGDLSRLGDACQPALFQSVPVINIDHHVTNTRFGDENWVDDTASSVSEMIHDLLPALGIQCDDRIATCLLTGLVTDTLGFRTSSTTPRTLRAAAGLMAAGAPLYDIVEGVFGRKSLNLVRLWGRILSTFQNDAGIVWATVPERLLQEHGVSEDDVKGLASFLRGTEGTEVAILIMEAGGGKVKVEFRSAGRVDVSAVAVSLGGGGHRVASGCTLSGSLAEVEARVVAAVRQAMS